MRDCLVGLCLFPAILLWASADAGFCQESTDKKADTISATTCDEKKRAAIEELLKVTEFDQRVELFSKVLESNAMKAFKLTIAKELKLDKKYNELDKESFDKAVEEQSKELFEQYMELFKERIDLSKVVKKIAFDTYAKYFSSKEIEDIVAFYKTPSGAKARKIMPKLARESLTETQEFMRPKLQSILKTVLDSRKSKQEEEVEAKAES